MLNLDQTSSKEKKVGWSLADPQNAGMPRAGIVEHLQISDLNKVLLWLIEILTFIISSKDSYI